MKKKTEMELYIQYVYSKDSEFNKIEDLTLRKERAAAKAGLDIEDPEIRNAMNLKVEKVRVEIINYLQKTQPNEFLKLMADQQLFFNLQQQLLKPFDDNTDTSKLMQISSQSEELLERMERVRKKVYMEPELIEEAEKKVRVMTPEMRLKEVANSKGNRIDQPSEASLASR